MHVLRHAWDALAPDFVRAAGPAIFFRVQPKKIRILPRKVRRYFPSPAFLRGKNSEEVGFEPTDPVRGLLFSRQVQSAALPLFQNK